jgi:hypothetical protein
MTSQALMPQATADRAGRHPRGRCWYPRGRTALPAPRTTARRRARHRRVRRIRAADPLGTVGEAPARSRRSARTEALHPVVDEDRVPDLPVSGSERIRVAAWQKARRDWPGRGGDEVGEPGEQQHARPPRGAALEREPAQQGQRRHRDDGLEELDLEREPRNESRRDDRGRPVRGRGAHHEPGREQQQHAHDAVHGVRPARQHGRRQHGQRERRSQPSPTAESAPHEVVQQQRRQRSGDRGRQPEADR